MNRKQMESKEAAEELLKKLENNEEISIDNEE